MGCKTEVMATQRENQQPALKIDLSTLQSAEIEHAKPGPSSPQLEKDAKRAMAHTEEWQPSREGGGGYGYGYRQEERRREVMMGSDLTASNSGSG